MRLLEGSEGIFLLEDSQAEASVIDFYPETNIEMLESTFGAQSFVRYWWDGQGINAADMFFNYDSLAAIYNATEAITGLTYINCNVPLNISYRDDIVIDESDTVMDVYPTYDQEYYRSIVQARMEERLNNMVNIESVESTNGDKVFYKMINIRVSGNSSNRAIEFDVTIKDNLGTKYLSLSKIRLEYGNLAFGSDIVANSGIIVTSGNMNSDTNCYYAPNPVDDGYNPQIVHIYADSKIGSQCKAPILTTAQIIMHVKMKLNNCNMIENLRLLDTASIAFITNVLDESLYSNSPNDQTPISYIEIDHAQSTLNPWCKATINSFTPHTISGGVNQILEIRGYLFGVTQGSNLVRFPNANDGGTTDMWTNGLDIDYWSDTLIKVKVPSQSSAIVQNQAVNDAPAGSGLFKVETVSDLTAVSPSSLNISYSFTNEYNSGEPVYLVTGIPDGGVYTFHCTPAVSAYDNGNMKMVIQKALDDWSCLTGITWILGPDVVFVGNGTAIDNMNIISLSSSLSSVTVAEANSHIIVFAPPANRSIVKEFDIRINSNNTMFCDTSSAIIPPNEKDFYFAILHELGHCHSLQHVNSSSNIMYYANNSASYNRKIDLENDYSCDEGGHKVIQWSTAFSQNTYNVMGATKLVVNPNPPCSHYLGTFEYESEDVEMTPYPNPFTNDLSIKMSSTVNTTAIVRIFDFGGRLVYTNKQKIHTGENILNLKTNHLATGMYVLNITATDNSFTVNTKIIRE